MDRLKSAAVLTLLRNVILLAVLIPNGSVWAQSPTPITLEEVLSIGSMEDSLLFQWVGVAVDRDHFIYVTDTMDYSLKKFDAAGHLVKKTGRRGQGPGEFTAPRLLDGWEEHLFVTEQYAPLVKVFDRNLRFQHTIRLKGPVGDLKALPGDRLAVVILTLQKKSVIFFYDLEGEIIDELVYSEKSGAFLTDMVSFDIDKKGHIYVAYNFLDLIEKFDRTGKRMWSKKLLGIQKVEKKKVSSFTVPTEIVYKDVALDTSGRLYVLGGQYSENRSRDVYVIEPEGRHVATFTLPHSSHCIYIDKEDHLYARANDGVTLKKYRMAGLGGIESRKLRK